VGLATTSGSAQGVSGMRRLAEHQSLDAGTHSLSVVGVVSKYIKSNPTCTVKAANITKNFSTRPPEACVRPCCTLARCFTLVVKTIAEFDIDFARIVPVGVAEGDAVVEFDASAGNVDRVHRSGKAFTEILAQSHVEPGRPRQVVSGIRLAGKSIGEAGTVVSIRGSVGAPGQRQVAADAKRVALIVIERTPGKNRKNQSTRR
jgi:hypothetical protein